ncbi:MAG: hypothetical protein ISS67_05765 [Desulfobacterales bacterium]|uniref:Uncharacterized protein n=1 Tax=Candidatus Desulfaltia bathyphila TaxID=2841697 RepID=A0A8J6N6E9_9BACT|nr:hypothetical protein [Candidatus Desulfaltia bathyphila]MBL7195276.1 hypothetical protein [Desulfobacterales bacterium]MBL7208012.1 hypothetical protein [Desulfobacterales bacterium]
MTNILILTYEKDPHAESVCKYFNNINAKYLKVDTEKLSSDFDISKNRCPPALHHIIARGIERKKIFTDGVNRDNF